MPAAGVVVGTSTINGNLDTLPGEVDGDGEIDPSDAIIIIIYKSLGVKWKAAQTPSPRGR